VICVCADIALSHSEATAIDHTLDYATSAEARKIAISQKTASDGSIDKIFVDLLGREAYFRGWNVSGAAKHVEKGFKPFRNTDDAELSFNLLGQKTGSNVVRFLIHWEGVHPEPDVIDYAYLDQVIAQMRKAIERKIYILVDYHQDLFSRHLFNQDSWHTGNGAPEWVMVDYPDEYCGLVCASWSQHNLTDEAVRMAFRNFWNNASFQCGDENRNMQDEYIWQIGEMAAYLRANMTDEEFDFILGLDPFNEPVDGGMEGLTAKEWDNQKLWPFFQRVRTVLNENGWGDKWVYAEPLVYWNTTAGVLAPATGGHHLDSPPGDGFVFNSHFYDAGRMSTDLTGIDNGTYLRDMDTVRQEGRYLETPTFMSEYGMWLDGEGAKDTVRMIKALYQGMEASDWNKTKDRYMNLYAPLISGTQWHWDIYYDNHNEYMNGNPDKLLTEKDAWNDENFSVIKDWGAQYNMDYLVIERGYPRRIQGHAMSYYYNCLSHDAWGSLLDWVTVKVNGDDYFGANKFMLLVWKGRNSDAPTELYIPRHFDIGRTLVVTESLTRNCDLALTDAPANEANEIIVTSDPGQISGSGYRLIVWDDLDDGETAQSMHFALVVELNSGENYTEQQVSQIQAALIQRISDEKQSPLYMTGTMTDADQYP
jgi:hypothetical protein